MAHRPLTPRRALHDVSGLQGRLVARVRTVHGLWVKGSSGANAVNATVVLSCGKYGSPKKVKSRPIATTPVGRGSDVSLATVAWAPDQEELHMELSRASTLKVFVKSHDTQEDSLGTGELRLPNLDLVTGAEHLVCVPLSPQGELFLSLQFEDNSELFGADLALVCTRERQPIPHIVSKCIQAVEAHGLSTGKWHGQRKKVGTGNRHGCVCTGKKHWYSMRVHG
eukprot:m.73259 g.73259  ORF g.73259 m.73259 type:complete len:224 (-) comp14331_c0_seq2:314-985(-)